MSPRWLHWPAAAAVEDWDTYADGIFYNPTVDTSVPADGEWLQGASWGSTIQGNNPIVTADTVPVVYNQSNYPELKNVASGDSYPSYIAIWNHTDSVWIGVYQFSNWVSARNGADYRTAVEGFDPPMNQPGTTLANGEAGIFVFLTQAPTNYSGWSSYNGPTP